MLHIAHLMRSIRSSPNPLEPWDASLFFASRACNPPCFRDLALFLLLAFVDAVDAVGAVVLEVRFNEVVGSADVLRIDGRDAGACLCVLRWGAGLRML